MKDVKINTLTNNINYIISKISCNNDITLLIRLNLGSRDETKENSGISHLLEHMLFQGTKKYPSQKELTKELYKYGGNFNAYTSKDHTVFYINIHKDYIEKALEILSDIYFNSLIKDENLTKEKKEILRMVRFENYL